MKALPQRLPDATASLWKSPTWPCDTIGYDGAAAMVGRKYALPLRSSTQREKWLASCHRLVHMLHEVWLGLEFADVMQD